ncbi:50S ribosomal protein L29 [Solimonas sp. SE-A11]|jgi:large subunit ribosomal protein L29|uniref:50S ribosomal protein L29 n=1 Tax=Solimonas sp. SE-A11 TaxID=3054954 RepID=UPI00259CA9A1|nr:50S ribosomal protein L29 [Solimonas sp. SE-A11]MDM4772501.1 50S ribosomal protein L29 [Solimonas sp. SE-A11]
MKAQEYLKSLRAKGANELKEELLALRKEQFNLRMQKAIGQQNQSHLITIARKKVAQVKTLMRQQVK